LLLLLLLLLAVLLSSAVGLAEAEEAEEDLLWSLVSESEPPLLELYESSPVREGGGYLKNIL
jgi:hypothetical protein